MHVGVLNNEGVAHVNIHSIEAAAFLLGIFFLSALKKNPIR